jgi:hypothetical protein
VTSGGSCEHGNEPLGSIKAGNFFTNCVTVSFSRRTVLFGVSYNYFCIFISTIISFQKHGSYVTFHIYVSV